MVILCKMCKTPVEVGRARIGLDTCLVHGDSVAKKEIEEKKALSLPAYNKGPTMLVSKESARQALLDAGRKTSAVNTEFIPVVGQKPLQAKVRKRKKIGLYWIGKDCFVWWDGEDLPNNCCRSVRL